MPSNSHASLTEPHPTPEQSTLACTRCAELQEMAEAMEAFIGRTNEQLLRSEMSHMEMEQIFSSCVDPMMVVREDGIIVRANKMMLHFLDKTLDEVIGNSCHELLSAEECALAAVKKKTVQTDIERLTAEGDPMSFIMTTSPIVTLDGSPGTLAQYKDITDRKRAELELAKAHKALEEIARIDGLTRIPNRRTFDETLHQNWLSSCEQQQPLSIVLCDIDFFKKYNDSYGHQQGDDCLVQVAQALQQTLDGTAGLAARYGGEEFIFLLPDTPLPLAVAIAETARTKVAGLQIEHKESNIAPHVTLSLGVSTLVPNATHCSQQLIKSADNALYLSKENGRNCVTTAPAT